jgi:hypothetical protein
VTKEQIAARGTEILRDFHAERISIANALEILAGVLAHIASRSDVSRKEFLDNLARAYDRQSATLESKGLQH